MAMRRRSYTHVEAMYAWTASYRSLPCMAHGEERHRPTFVQTITDCHEVVWRSIALQASSGGPGKVRCPISQSTFH